MRAMAFLALVHEPADASAGLLPPASLTVVDELPHSHGLSFTVPATPEGTHSFRAPPGTWNILVDDGRHALVVLPEISLKPGQAMKLVIPSVESGERDSLLVRDQRGEPIAGATLTLRAEPGTARDALLRRWSEGRRLRSASKGEVSVDRLPEPPRSWEIHAEGFRDARINVRPNGRTEARKSRTRRLEITLRPLPALRVRIVDAKPSAPVRVEIRRLPTGTDPSRREASARIWEGPVDSEIVVPAVRSGYYRAQARIDGRVAVGDARVDASAEAADVQDLVVSTVEKTIDGRVTRAGEPIADVRVEALPADADLTEGTARLASATTDAGGGYHLSFSYRGNVTVLATIGAWSKMRTIDLTVVDHTGADFEFRAGRVRVRTVDRVSGEPVARATVSSEFAPKGSASEGVRIGTTDENGELALEDLEEGTLTVKAVAERYSSKVLRNVLLPPDVDLVLKLELTSSSAYRIRTRDGAGNRIANAELLVLEDLRSSRPRTARVKLLGRTNDQGELVLDALLGEPEPAFAVAAGYTARLLRLPAAADPDADLDQNTQTVVLSPFMPGPGIRIRNPKGAIRDDALVVFAQTGVEIPLSVLARSAQLNGIPPAAVFYAQGDGTMHYQELLAPGDYQVEILSPGGPDAATDLRDPIGSLRLPLERPVDLTWREDRPYD